MKAALFVMVMLLGTSIFLIVYEGDRGNRFYYELRKVQAAMAEQAENFTAQREGLAAELADTKAAFSNEKASLKNKIDSLDNENDSLGREIDSLFKEVLTADAAIASLEKENGRLGESLAKSQSQIAALDPPIVPWQSLDELEAFLAADIVTIRLHADGQGKVDITGQCEDMAMGLCRRARAAGSLIETEILIASEVLKYYAADAPEAPHCICKAVIGNDVYFIEPGNDRVWLAYYLD